MKIAFDNSYRKLHVEFQMKQSTTKLEYVELELQNNFIILQIKLFRIDFKEINTFLVNVVFS